MTLTTSSLKMALSLMAIAATVATAGAARADVAITRDCTETIGGHKFEAISTPATDGTFSSRLLVDDKEIAPLGAGCWAQVVPVFRGGVPIVTRSVRCSFQVGDDRLELYPVTETTSGEKKFMQFILWQGDRVKAGSFDNCVE